MKLTFVGTGNALGATIDFFMGSGFGNSARTAGQLVGGVAGLVGDTGSAVARGYGGHLPDSRQRALVGAIEQAVAADDPARLLELADEFVQRAPREPMGPVWQAMALLDLGRHGQALDAIERAGRLGLPGSDQHYLRAEILMDAGRHTEVIQELGFLVDDPEHRHSALIGRANTFLELGDVEQALRDADRAVELAPDASAWFTRGEVHRAMGELARCLEDYGRADRIQPNWLELLQNRAVVHDQLGHTAEAAADRAAVQAAGDLDPAGAPMVEARTLLAYLRQNGVRIDLAANGRDLEIRGTTLRTETRATVARLKPQLVALLTTNTG